MTASERTVGASPGLLQIVATPIGNLEDLSPRARRALGEADVIAAEDTRRTGRLLERLGIPAPRLASYFAPREQEKSRTILRHLAEGRTVVLLSDAGTPGISDPGAVLIGRARAAGVRIEAVPGPSAVTAALSISSLGGDRFVFEGFLPSKAVGRRKRLEELVDERRTIVFYEAPHRLTRCLEDLAAIFGPDRIVTIVREVTKRYEETREGPVGELVERFAEGVRGEIVLVVAGSEAESDRIPIDAAELLRLAAGPGVSPEQAARRVAEVTGLPRSRLTRLARRLVPRDA